MHGILIFNTSNVRDLYNKTRSLRSTYLFEDTPVLLITLPKSSDAASFRCILARRVEMRRDVRQVREIATEDKARAVLRFCLGVFFPYSSDEYWVVGIWHLDKFLDAGIVQALVVPHLLDGYF